MSRPFIVSAKALYAGNLLMKEFWAVLIVLFGLAFSLSEFLSYLERNVAFYAGPR
ncbi:MAG: hypothetical protein KKB02_05090 [Alphaproteobacteria bacterium]|nr:hypothetical protein [Alphaproteobacteria bacterium]